MWQFKTRPQLPIALVFNRQYESSRNMTVGKTFVSEVIKKYRYEISMQRKKIKYRVLGPSAINRVWGMDLTQVRDTNKNQHLVLGVLDHGSRTNLMLARLETKASIAILRTLLNCIEKYGKPKIIRTDNEAVFVSRLFRMGLWLLGINHQRIDPHCPWQNGRIERFFGTFKEKARQVIFPGTDSIDTALMQFRVWYNHVRPHQHLNGRTPAEVWNNQSAATGKGEYFRAWDGVLT